MNAPEWKLYQEWFSWLVDEYAPKISGFVYLQTDPAVCYKRLVKRGRTEEFKISFDYLTTIHIKHKQWLAEGKEVEALTQKIPVLILECSKDFESDLQEHKGHCKKISNFFAVPFVLLADKEKNASMCL